MLPSFPIGITFGEFLDRAGLAAFRGVVGVERTKHLVNGVKQSAENFETPCRRALNQAQVVVNINVEFGKAAASVLEAREERIGGCGSGHARRVVGRRRRSGLRSRGSHSSGLQPMGRLGTVLEQGDVGEVRNSFGRCTEPRRGLHPTHGKRQGEGNERLAGVGEIGEDNAQLGDVLKT
jgi:hypothetical protein